MANSFDCFFEKYKKLLNEYDCSKKGVIDKTRKWTVIAVVCIVTLLCLILFLYRIDDVLCVCIAIALLICVTILFANINPYPATGPDERPYLNHSYRVIGLLKEYGIEPTDMDRVYALIDCASNMIARRDPLADIRRAMVITGSAGAVISTVLSGALEGTIDLLDSIPYVIVVLALIFVAVLFFSRVSEFFARLFFPDKRKYQKLIDDLNHILIFDMNRTIKNRLKGNAEQLNVSNGEEKQAVQ